MAIIAESFLPHMNGVTNSILRTLDYLAANGHEAMVIAPGTRETPNTVNGFPVRVIPSFGMPGYQAVRFTFAPSFTYEMLLEDFQPDVVHLAAPFLVGYKGALAAARLGLPMVALYQTDVANYASLYGFTAMRPWIWHRVTDIHDLATLTLAPSSYSIEQLRSHDIHRLRLWGRGVDVERFHPSKRSAQFRAQYAPHGEKIIGYVGRVAPEKRIDDLAVLADIPGTTTVIIGDGPAMADSQTTLPRAHFLGQLNGEELATAYASMDIFVTPGELETFGQTIQEAMASGVPVIAPAKGGPIDLIDHGQTGYLYEPGDLDALRNHTVELLSDDSALAKFSNSARACVETKTWDHICAQLVDYYQEAINASA